MVSWGEFADAAPRLAEDGAELLRRRIAYRPGGERSVCIRMVAERPWGTQACVAKNAGRRVGIVVLETRVMAPHQPEALARPSLTLRVGVLPIHARRFSGLEMEPRFRW